jgi:hypothetical protein
LQVDRRHSLRRKGASNIAQDGDRVIIIFGHMIDHARFAPVQIAPAQFLGADNLARRGLYQGRPGQKDRPLSAHDHASSHMAGT